MLLGYARGMVRSSILVSAAISCGACGDGAAAFDAPGEVDARPPDRFAASCEAADVQAAIDAASDGEVVGIPAGSCAWTTGVKIEGKGIHLTGVSLGDVTITNDAGNDTLLELITDDSHHVELSGLRLIEGATTADAHLAVFGSQRAVKVHDNYFETNGGLLRSIRWGSPRGVVWRNEFFSNRQDDQAIVFLGAADSWTTADTMGTRDVDGESNVYVEDNLFRELYVQALDPDSNSRVVIRHNRFESSGMASHGADTSEAGTRHWEIYDNTFTFVDLGGCTNTETAPLNWYFFIRGGTGVIADNVMPDIASCVWGDKPEINMTVMNLRRNAGPYPCWTTYPAPRQVGQGHDGTQMITDPVHIWGNSGGGDQEPGLSDYTNECGPGAPTTADFVQPGRDYIVGSPRPGYTKYPYPHPLR